MAADELDPVETEVGVEVRYSWGRMEWLAGLELRNATTISVARMFMLPRAVSEAHRHPNCEEAILVARGRVEIQVGDRRSTRVAGDCVVVAPGAVHRLENLGSEDAELTLMYGSGRREYESESD